MHSKIILIFIYQRSYINISLQMNTNNNASLSASLGLAYTQTKQKQIPKSAELHQSFKTTTNLAHGLTKERVTIQNEL